MPKRRDHGEGTVSYDEKRKRWFYYLPRDEMGRRQRVSGKTKAEVLAKAEELKAKRAQGLDLDTKQPTVEQFGEVWLRDVVKRTRRESTHAGYEQMFSLYINPKIGKIRLLLALGLRRGEGLGLSWDDVDWEAGTVQIRRQVQAINTRVVISEYTKTDSGRRTLPVSPTLLARLRVHWLNQQEDAH